MASNPQEYSIVLNTSLHSNSFNEFLTSAGTWAVDTHFEPWQIEDNRKSMSTRWHSSLSMRSIGWERFCCFAKPIQILAFDFLGLQSFIQGELRSCQTPMSALCLFCYLEKKALRHIVWYSKSCRAMFQV